VNTFLGFLEPKLKKVCFKPNQLYLRDETGISIEQHKNINVIAMKDKRAATSLVSAERGCLLMMVTCMNVVVHFVPLLVLFLHKNMQIELMVPFMPVIYQDGSKLTFLHSGSGIIFQP
jgi:hypothetical protein